jgi:methylmalonyl-CoA mutase, C-terminal domain
VDDPAELTPGRVLLAKPGMDAHWRGLAVVARVLRNAGFEVIYVGHGRPAEIASAAVEEDADVIGLSTLSGNHLESTRELLAALDERGLAQLPVVVGGNIGPADVELLLEMGAHDVLGPGATADQIVAHIDAAVSHRRTVAAPRITSGGQE